MFDIGFAELVLLFIIGLLILGPERLPRVASQIGRWVGRARRTASQLRHQLEREIALNDLRRPPKSKPPEPPSGAEKSDAPDGSKPGPEEAAAEDAGGETAPSEGSGSDDKPASHS